MIPADVPGLLSALRPRRPYVAPKSPRHLKPIRKPEPAKPGFIHLSPGEIVWLNNRLHEVYPEAGY
jgi:hypothetical protein